MSEQDNIKHARQIFDAWNSHDPERYVKLLDEKYVVESDTLPQTLTGRDASRQFFVVYVTAFPDLHFSIDQILAVGEYVVTRWTATGTHRGDLMGLAPTNRHAVTHGCSVSEYQNGRPRHDRVYWDSGNLLRQLGALPAFK
jgi:steroid delta-isomerase-like uncharacterized protein